MMEFNFIDEEEEDEEFLDLSDLYEDEDEGGEEKLEVAGLGFSFADEVPEARSITDPEVQSKARRSRKRSPSARDFYGKMQAGWSLYCSHKKHLPNLCEKEQTNGEVTCTCPCHTERGYVRPEPQSVSGSDDEILVLDLG